MKCSRCHADNLDDSRFCRGCGATLEATAKSSPESPKEQRKDEISFTKTLETSADELVRGLTFAGRHEVIEELGKGGMGRVYRVFDTKIEEKVALKLIKPEIVSEKKTIERFENELKTARKIAHRNVCRMFDLSEKRGTHFITMEYVAG